MKQIATPSQIVPSGVECRPPPEGVEKEGLDWSFDRNRPKKGLEQEVLVTKRDHLGRRRQLRESLGGAPKQKEI